MDKILTRNTEWSIRITVSEEKENKKSIALMLLEKAKHFCLLSLKISKITKRISKIKAPPFYHLYVD